MPRITRVRPILLSAPYASPEDLEVRLHLPHGLRTCGMVEITLEDGTRGLGEGYLAVFAPLVFVEIVELMAPCLVGRESLELNARYREMCAVSDYWSLQGAARHVISALETALLDANALHLNVPACVLLGGLAVDSMRLYGSGGDSTGPDTMGRELELLASHGIALFKIRARSHQFRKAAWTMNAGEPLGIAVAVDMTQNLANPAQTVAEAARFVGKVHQLTDQRIDFLEEALGPFDLDSYHLLRSKTDCKIAGGEVVTTAQELCQRIERKLYDYAQPDATVIGGTGQVMEVFAQCRRHGAEAVVHCWGGPVGMMANYHAAFAGGGRLAEWPMKSYPLREELMVEPLRIKDGMLSAPQSPGLGVRLTPELEEKYSFRKEAIYNCAARPLPMDEGVWSARKSNESENV